MTKPVSNSDARTVIPTPRSKGTGPLQQVDTAAATISSQRQEMDTPTITGGGDEMPRTPPPGSELEDWSVDQFIGKILANRYKVIERIGIGGFGAVFSAEDTKIGKRVAVKVLAPELVSDSAMLTRFRKEAEAASKVGHENIIDITDFDRTVTGYYFLVMELLEGTDLGSIIREGNRLPISRILGVMIQVCRALYAAHNKGIVHRDLKPGNIFLIDRGSNQDFVKLLDFGISKFLEMDDESSRLTKTGQIIGTPLYMSPEQALGEEDLDHRVDVYSLGVIMYELITGQPPFTAVNYLGIIAQHASDPPRPPSKVRPDLEIPPQVETIILKAMAKQPGERFSTMAEMEGAMIHALAAVDPASAVTYSPDATPPSILTTATGVSQRRLTSSKPVPVWALLLAALVGIAGALYVALGQDPAPPPAPKIEIRPRPRPVPPPINKKAVGNPVPDSGAASQPTTAADATRPEERMVTVRVISVPPGATILGRNGVVLGKTPTSLEMEKSDQPLVLLLKRPRYLPARREITPNNHQRVVIPMKKRRRGGGLPDDPKKWGER